MPTPALGRGGKPLARNRDGSPVTFRLRVRYQKQGRAAMLSHLEVTRALERVIRRAGLPYAITNGFSPHMRASFGSALPVGVGSTGEYLDVLLTERVDPQQALSAMQEASAPVLMVLGCEYISAKAPAASAAFPFSTYVAEFSEPLPVKSIDELPVPETVTVIRKKKEKVLRVADYLQPGTVLDGDRLIFTLESGENGNLRPDVLVNAIVEAIPGVRVQSITRISQRNA
ncbi:MAG: DUF2344 domain-containing protein [Eggerthellaceae bacterium]|nr:DUF2344 domain-containing protein [Eggerthellaceae bacterium]